MHSVGASELVLRAERRRGWGAVAGGAKCSCWMRGCVTGTASLQTGASCGNCVGTRWLQRARLSKQLQRARLFKR
eukprot:362201-Chlamydomonas_euryale.AAC.6